MAERVKERGLQGQSLRVKSGQWHARMQGRVREKGFLDNPDHF